MKKNSATHEQRQRAAHRQTKNEHRDRHDQQDLNVADADIGHDLRQHDLDRPQRHGEQIFHRATLASRG